MQQDQASRTTAHDARRPRAVWRGALSALALAGGGAVFGYGLVHTIEPWLDALVPADLPRAVKLAVIPALVVAAWSAIAVHELGHVVGGVRGGLRFQFLTAGPLLVERRPDGWHVGWNRFLATWGGLALCLPTSDDESRESFERYFLGGPIASLALGVAALALAVVSAEVLGPNVAAGGLLLVALMSFAILVATGQWFTSSSDGGRWRALRRGDDAARGELALMVLSGLALAGTRARDWPRSLVADLAQVQAERSRPGAELLLAEFEWDRGERTSAVDRIERLLEGELDAMVRPGVAVERVVLAGLEGRAFETEGLEREFDGPFVERHRQRLAEAVLTARRGDVVRARASVQEARELYGSARFPVHAPQREQADELERLFDGPA